MGYEHSSAMVLLAPFFLAIAAILAGLVRPQLARPLAILGALSGLLFSIDTLLQVAEHGSLEYRMGNWAPPMGIVLVIDWLNAPLLTLISAVALVTIISGKHEIETRYAAKAPALYCLMLLFVTGVLGITATGDAFNLYVLIEVSALTGYALIAQGDRKAILGAYHYIIVGTIGASFYLLGVGYLFIKTGSLNMDEVRHILYGNDALANSSSLSIAFILIFLGLAVKMALFPMHGWLPNAYGRAPLVSSCLIAPLMTKVMIYAMARMMVSVFGLDYILAAVAWKDVVVGIAIAGILAGSVMALAQRDYRRMLCYLIIAEVGYMVGGLWILSDGMISGTLAGALYHVIADGAMTLCLFLFGAAVYLQAGHTRFSALEKFASRSPWTFAAFLVGAFAMLGIPPTCGFFSKWYLIGGAFELGYWPFAAALILSSLVNAVLFFRIIEIAFFGAKPSEGHHHHEDSHQPRREAPASILIPLWISAASLIALGLYNADLYEVIERTLYVSVYANP